MNLKPGWFARQAEAAVREVASWPAWKRREAGIDHLFPGEPILTADDCWARIAECTRVRNWHGVAARARELATLDNGAADGLLWAVKTQSVPRWRVPSYAGVAGLGFWQFVICDEDGEVIDSWEDYGHRYARPDEADDAHLRKGWEWVIARRQALIAHYRDY